MQTFLPYQSFVQSAKCLDYKRLGKQRIEAIQILKNLWGLRDRWYNHPAVQLWKGYETTLKIYYNCIVAEWEERGYKNNMPKFTIDLSKTILKVPPWLGNPDFHDAHKSNLLKKDEKFYSKYNWNVPKNLKYKWK